MRYFLDFDRTLFDTDAYNASLADEPACADFADEIRTVLAAARDDSVAGNAARQKVWAKVSDAIASRALVFQPGYLARFLYADVPEMLRELGNEATIITYGERNRQQSKIESALAQVVRTTVLYTESKLKAEFFATWAGYQGGPVTFVDDRPIELQKLSELYPNARFFEMRRDGTPGTGVWPIVHSLAELPIF